MRIRQDITVQAGWIGEKGIKYKAKAVDILNSGELLVETENGMQTLNSGEIKICTESII